MTRRFSRINYIGDALHRAADTRVPQIFASPLGWAAGFVK